MALRETSKSGGRAILPVAYGEPPECPLANRLGPTTYIGPHDYVLIVNEENNLCKLFEKVNETTY